MFTQKFIKIFHSVYEIEPFSLFQSWHSANPRPMIYVILQLLELDLVNINVSAKFYQNIPNDLRVKFRCFQNLKLSKNLDQSQMSFDYLIGYIMSISMCMQNFISSRDIPLSSRDRSIFTFSEFGARQSLDRQKMSFRNLLG